MKPTLRQETQEQVPPGKCTNAHGLLEHCNWILIEVAQQLLPTSSGPTAKLSAFISPS